MENLKLKLKKGVFLLICSFLLIPNLAYGQMFGGGKSKFISLTDSPVSYASKAGQYIRVNATEDGVEFVAAGAGGNMNTSTYDTDTDGDIDVAAGGTEKSSWTQYCIPYLSGTTAFGEIAIGTAGYYLKVNGTATGYEWDVPSAGAGGSTTQVQYNSTGSLAGDAGFTYNAATDTATIGDISISSPSSIYSLSHDSFADFASGEHFTQSAITTTGTVSSGTWGADFSADIVKDTDLDFGTGAGQISADDLPDGSTYAIITLTQETNFGTAYTHSQDNTQAHSDYLLNSGDDNTAGSIAFATGKGIQTGTTATNTLLLQAYDVDGAAYTTFATLTAANTPTMDLASGVTLGGAAIQTGTDDDVPESGDFGAGADLEADGSLSTSTVADNEMDYGNVTLNDFTFDVGSVSKTEFGYLNNVTSAIQTQLDGKAAVLGGDDNYVTDAEKIIIGNTSGTNTGDDPTDYISETEMDSLAEFDTQIGITGTPSGSTYWRGDNTWATISGGGDLMADGSVPLTANWDVGAYTITGTRFISDIATGTAPFGVSSTTVVTNLNADLLDGESASAFEDADADIAKVNEVETISANWINTANPWADNEVANDITITNISQVGDISATASEINTPLDGALVQLTEFAELETIDTTTISTSQWAGLGGATTAGIALWDDANAAAQLTTLGASATTAIPGMTSTTPKIIFAVNILNPDADCDDIKVKYQRGMTITQISYGVVGATSIPITLSEVDSDGDDSDAVVIDSAYTAGTTYTNDTSFTNAAIDANDYLQLDCGTPTGTPTTLSITIWGYET